jgi:diketogulonate reductase-like aldo/keto reductase
LNITPAQVIISWLVQRGTVALPKSVNPTRVEENLRVQKLPIALFTQLEASAVAHKPKRAVNPSEGWGLDYDVFDDYPYKA